MKNKVKKKLLIITGTRAEYGLLRPLIMKAQKSRTLKTSVVATGMHTLKIHGYTLDTLRKDRITLSGIIHISEKDDMLTSLSKEILGIKKACKKLAPDMIVVLGDRDEAFAGAIVGGHMKIPVAHIHGGDVTGYVVDEYIRHAITKFSHLHFAATKKSHERIKKLGEEGWRIFTVGAIGLDELAEKKLKTREKIARKLGLNGKKIWILGLYHPTPLDTVSFAEQILPYLRALKRIHAEIILVYPNSDEGSAIFIREIEKMRKYKNFHIYKNIDRRLFLGVLAHAEAILGNSSSGIIEAGYFKTPAVNIGMRQFGRERGKNVIDSPYSENSIFAAMKKAMSKNFQKKLRNAKHPYGYGNASKKILTLIEKYIFKKNLLYKKFT